MALGSSRSDSLTFTLENLTLFKEFSNHSFQSQENVFLEFDIICYYKSNRIICLPKFKKIYKIKDDQCRV